MSLAELNEKVEQFVEKDEEILKKQFEEKGNDEGWISFMNEANVDLETVLRLDQTEDINE